VWGLHRIPRIPRDDRIGTGLARGVLERELNQFRLQAQVAHVRQ